MASGEVEARRKEQSIGTEQGTEEAVEAFTGGLESRLQENAQS